MRSYACLVATVHHQATTAAHLRNPGQQTDEKQFKALTPQCSSADFQPFYMFSLSKHFLTYKVLVNQNSIVLQLSTFFCILFNCLIQGMRWKRVFKILNSFLITILNNTSACTELQFLHLCIKHLATLNICTNSFSTFRQS